MKKAEAEASAAVEEEKNNLQTKADATLAPLQAKFERERQALAVSLAADVRNKALEEKWRILDGLYAEVEKAILSDAGLYKKYLRRALDSLGSQVPVQIVCRPQDHKILVTLLKGMSVGQMPEFDETLPAEAGGFKAQFAGYMSDLTVHAACLELRERTVADVGHRLFDMET